MLQCWLFHRESVPDRKSTGDSRKFIAGRYLKDILDGNSENDALRPEGPSWLSRWGKKTEIRWEKKCLDDGRRQLFEDATSIGPSAGSVGRPKFGRASNIPMRKAPLADDLHVVFRTLCNHGLKPAKFPGYILLPIPAFGFGAFLAHSRPSEPPKSNCAQKWCFRRPATPSGSTAALLRAHVSGKAINSADAIPALSEDPERRRIEFSGNAEIWKYCGREGGGCPEF
ncbi:hypothetical protein C8R43DRAFT_958770 [Mycena crocata]|nr:hypothetical protein C8R43DRAFT_958770 [Mycena crocata]